MDKVQCPNNRCEIPAGDIQMGSTNGDSWERPVRQIHVSSFQLGKTEVTVGEYKRYLLGLNSVVSGRNFSRTVPNFSANQKGNNYPVVALNFNEMRAYCQSQGGDLPTAAQLERAAKGVSGTDQYGTPIDKAVIAENGYQSTAPVCGSNDERANSFGVCDLGGNVWETTRDGYDEKFYSRMPSKDPHNPATTLLELRGGSWGGHRSQARSAYRMDVPVYLLHSSNIGFRCAWPADSGKVK